MVIVLVSAKRRLHEISRDNGDDAENTEDEADGAKYPTVLVKCCGRLPLDCDPTAFLGRPANIDKTRRSPEGNCSRDYDRLARDAGIAVSALPPNRDLTRPK